MVELAGGQEVETVRRYRDRLVQVALTSPVTAPPATASTSFNRQGLPIYQEPRHVPWFRVGTDPNRLRCFNPEFRLLVATNPLADLVRSLSREPGYFAPRLEGIWARFPYLHNASVPNIRSLLTPPPRRPGVFAPVTPTKATTSARIFGSVTKDPSSNI